MLQNLICALLISAASPQLGGEAAPLPDLSAIGRFWPIYDALRADRDVGEDAWNALFATPAWQTLGSFRAQRARARYELAYRPSRREDKEDVITAGGYEAAVLRHLTQMVTRESELRLRARELADGGVQLHADAAVKRTAMYLPAGMVESEPQPRVAFAVFEPDGYADGAVIVDLLYFTDLGARAESMLAHEFHHAYQSRLVAPYTRPANGSADQVLLESLFQLQREGIADLIDKWPALRDRTFDEVRSREFLADMERSPAVFAALDERLAQLADTSVSAAQRLRLAREIRWRVLPRSGHATGLYMALRIFELAGRDGLIATLANPFEFLRTYTCVAVSAGYPVVGAEASRALSEAEERIFGAPATPRSACN